MPPMPKPVYKNSNNNPEIQNRNISIANRNNSNRKLQSDSNLTNINHMTFTVSSESKWTGQIGVQIEMSLFLVEWIFF